MIYLLIIASIFTLDFLIKRWIESQKSTDFPRTPKVFKNKIILYKNHNSGMIMGFIGKNQQITKLIPLGTTIILLIYYFTILIQKNRIGTKLSLSLILGGALSNLFDRYYYSYVVDYVSIQWKKLKDIVFNLSDIFIFLGCILLFFTELFRKNK